MSAFRTETRGVLAGAWSSSTKMDEAFARAAGRTLTDSSTLTA